jgi:hypothetical protein
MWCGQSAAAYKPCTSQNEGKGNSKKAKVKMKTWSAAANVP